ncbi:timeless family protein, partial [Prunus dulcis]
MLWKMELTKPLPSIIQRHWHWHGNPLDAGSVQILEDLQHEQMDNDLVDSGDEMAHGALVEIKLGGSYGVLVCINDEDGEMKRRFAE